jgi:PPOX class probable F420-dependent enzyme
MHPDELDDEALAFVHDRHLATLSTPRSDGTVHVVPVGFSFDSVTRLARIITRSGSWTARHIAAHPDTPVTIGQIDGGRWMSLEGTAIVTDDPARVEEAVDRYAARYRQPEPRADRVAGRLRRRPWPSGKEPDLPVRTTDTPRESADKSGGPRGDRSARRPRPKPAVRCRP